MVAFSIPANLAFDTYSGLLDAVHERMDREDLAGDFQTFVSLAEAMMQRELSLGEYEASTTLSYVDGVAELPSDYRRIRKLTLDGLPLTQLPVPGHTGTGFTIEAGTLFFWPVPETDGTAYILYTARFDGLSEANPTNSLLSEHPDLYFFGVLAHAADHIGDRTAAQQYMAMFLAAIQQVRAYNVSKKWAGPIRPRLPEQRV